MKNNIIHPDKPLPQMLPAPIPALADLYRVREAGSETRAYRGLDRNERLAPLPDWFMKKILQPVDSALLMHYPVHDKLLRQLAESLHVPEERVLLTSGSDAAVKAIYHAYFRPGDRVVVFDPSYAMYTVYAQMFQAQVTKIAFDRSLAVDKHKLLRSVEPGVRLVLLANPNQPTGTLLDEKFLIELVERAARTSTLVAIDEAYYPFSHYTALPLIENYPNLLVIRTFSKAAGLAGMRIGFIAGHAEVISNLFKVRTANDLNGFAIHSASQILSHPEIVDEYVSDVEAGARVLAEQARGMGLEPLPTRANFMLIRVTPVCQPATLIEALRERGYLVKGPFNFPCIQDCIRVTLGRPDLMREFAAALGDAVASIIKPVPSDLRKRENTGELILA